MTIVAWAFTLLFAIMILMGLQLLLRLAWTITRGERKEMDVVALKPEAGSKRNKTCRIIVRMGEDHVETQSDITVQGGAEEIEAALEEWTAKPAAVCACENPPKWLSRKPLIYVAGRIAGDIWIGIGVITVGLIGLVLMFAF